MTARKLPKPETCIKKLDEDMRTIARWLVHAGISSWEQMVKLRRKELFSFEREISIMTLDSLPAISKGMMCEVAIHDPLDWTQFKPESALAAKLFSSGCVIRDGESFRMPEAFLRDLRWLYGLQTSQPFIPRQMRITGTGNYLTVIK